MSDIYLATLIEVDEVTVRGKWKYFFLGFLLIVGTATIAAAQPTQTTLIQQAAEQGRTGDIGSIVNNTIGSIFSGILPDFGQILSDLWTSLQEIIRQVATVLAAALLYVCMNPFLPIDTGNIPAGMDTMVKLIVQTANVVRDLATDISLLLLILAIWRFWTTQSWRGLPGVWMSAVGRFIFALGLIITWPMIFNFQVNMTNEMLVHSFFQTPGDMSLLVSTVYTALNFGVLAGTGVLLSFLAPIIGAAAGSLIAPGPATIIGGFGGAVIGLVGTILFMIFGIVLITEIVYFLVLKAIQASLLTAQYVFAPLFLVCFASPDTEHIGSGFIRSFIEVSLWSFVWLGLLKVLCIILSSPLTGGSFLLIIGVLQIMIQVPAFLGRAQISPVSEFLTASAITGIFGQGLGQLGKAVTNAGAAYSKWEHNGKYAGVGTPETTSQNIERLPEAAADSQRLKEIIASTRSTEAPPPKNGGTKSQTSTTQTGAAPPVVTPSTQPSQNGNGNNGNADSKINVPDAHDVAGIPAPPAKLPAASAQSAGVATTNDNGASSPTVEQATAAHTSPASATTSLTTPGAESTAPQPAANVAQTLASLPLVTAPESADDPEDHQDVQDAQPTNGKTVQGAAGTGTGTGTGTGAGSGTGTGAGSGTGAGTASGGSPNRPPEKLEGWRRMVSRNYGNAWIRPMIEAINNGQVLLVEGDQNGVVMNPDDGTVMITYAKGATDEQIGQLMAIGGTAFGQNRTPQGRDRAREAVMRKHLGGPQTIKERLLAGLLYATTGQQFTETKLGQSRARLAMMNEMVEGSADYITMGETGDQNEVSKHLTQTFGEETPERQAVTLAQMLDEKSTEGGSNRATAIGTRTAIDHGFQINDLVRALAAKPIIAGQMKANQKAMLGGAIAYNEARAWELGYAPGQFSNEIAQPLANSMTNEEAYACMAIAGQDGQDACVNQEMVRAVAGLGSAHDPNSFRTAYRNMKQLTEHLGGADQQNIAVAARALRSTTSNNAPVTAMQNTDLMQRMGSAGYDVTSISNADLEAANVLPDHVEPSPSNVALVRGDQDYQKHPGTLPAHLDRMFSQLPRQDWTDENRDFLHSLTHMQGDPGVHKDPENIRRHEPANLHYVAIATAKALTAIDPHNNAPEPKMLNQIVGKVADYNQHHPGEKVPIQKLQEWRDEYRAKNGNPFEPAAPAQFSGFEAQPV